jgi:hypothetical protein
MLQGLSSPDGTALPTNTVSFSHRRLLDNLRKTRIRNNAKGEIKSICNLPRQQAGFNFRISFKLI